MQKKIFIFLSIFTFIFAYVVYEAILLDRKFESTANSNNTVLKQIPSVSFIDFESKENVGLQKVVGEQDYLFIHFWATWCAPCEVEFPELVEFLELMKNDSSIKFLLVAVNDERAKVEKFLRKFNLSAQNVLVLSDDIDAHKEFGTYKMPETFLFSKSGQLVKKFSGKQSWIQPHIVDYFESL